MSTTWRRFGAFDVSRLVDTRTMLHHAAQLTAAPGRSLLETRADDSQAALEWSHDLQALQGQPIPGPVPWRAALRPADLTLLVVNDREDGAVAFLLAGRSFDEAFAWLKEQASEREAEIGRLSMDRPYDLPEHPVAAGARFPSPPPPDLAELARHFANSDRLFRRLLAEREDDADVLCWPHHFDLGTSLRLDPGAGDTSPTVGWGMSPGDERIEEPYFYVNGWPRPAALPDPLPALPEAARWVREGWFGAVLPTHALVEVHEAEGQEARAEDFFEKTTATLEGLLSRP